MIHRLIDRQYSKLLFVRISSISFCKSVKNKKDQYRPTGANVLCLVPKNFFVLKIGSMVQYSTLKLNSIVLKYLSLGEISKGCSQCLQSFSSSDLIPGKYEGAVLK